MESWHNFGVFKRPPVLLIIKVSAAGVIMSRSTAAGLTLIYPCMLIPLGNIQIININPYIEMPP